MDFFTELWSSLCNRYAILNIFTNISYVIGFTEQMRFPNTFVNNKKTE